MKSTRIEREEQGQGSGLSNVEDDLRILFRPVKPRPSYVSESKTRLIQATQQKRSWLAALQLLIMAMTFIAGGVFILVLSIRAAITLLSTLGLLQLVKDEARRKRAILGAGSPIIPAPAGELLQ